MNKKRICAVAVMIIVLVSAIFVLTACNKYKWASIGAGDSAGTVVSNGGYYVEQGGYAYFINGYVGDNDANDWGTPYKQSIMRAALKEDGTIDNSTAKVVVPKSIYNQNANGGFAIYGDWIYYATPNNDEDNTGTASTTHTDFMRTKTDGSITQLIGTINSRSSNYLFTPTRVLFSTDSNATVYYFDFSGMKENKSLSNRKGVTEGVLIENATSVVWGYDLSREAGAGAQVSDYVFYTEKLTDKTNSYEFYNKLCCVRYDGTDRRVLLDNTSFLAEGDNYLNTPEKVFNFSLSKLYYESDNEVTLYYTKSIEVNSSSVSVGLYSNTFTLDGGLSAAGEKRLTENSTTTFFAMGKQDGILVLDNSKYYLVTGTEEGDVKLSDRVTVIGATSTVQAVIGGYVYYTDSNALYRINLDAASNEGSPNAEQVVSAGVKTDWLSLEFVVKGANVFFFYFDTEEYTYTSYVNLAAFDGEALTPVMIGDMTQADKDAKAEEEAEEE